MKVLMISGDRRVVEPGSEAAARLALQRSAVEQLDVFVWPQIDSMLRVGAAAWKGRYEVVTVQDPFWRGLVGYAAARLSGARLNVQVHADLAGQSALRRAIAAFLLRHADTVRVVSERVRKTLPAPVAERAQVLPVYSNLEPFMHIERRAHVRFAQTILWIGRFEPEKNPLRALSIVERVRAAGVDAGLIMLGAGSLEETLRRQAEQMALPVEFPGWQDPKEFLPVADVVLSTSAYESYGVSIIESLAAGVPVVSLDVGVAKEAGAVVCRPERMAETVVEVLRKKMRGELRIPVLDEAAWARAWRETL